MTPDGWEAPIATGDGKGRTPRRVGRTAENLSPYRTYDAWRTFGSVSAVVARRQRSGGHADGNANHDDTGRHGRPDRRGFVPCPGGGTRELWLRRVAASFWGRGFARARSTEPGASGRGAVARSVACGIRPYGDRQFRLGGRSDRLVCRFSRWFGDRAGTVTGAGRRCPPRGGGEGDAGLDREADRDARRVVVRYVATVASAGPGPPGAAATAPSSTE